ncbi:MAG: deoxyuridine 5'-triphosphate nucleotidohydrolase [Eubacteriales bacterium]
MKRVAKFEKVSKEQFLEGFQSCFTDYKESEICQIYEELPMPRRATKGSAGYDFFSPITFTLQPGESIKIPTGIRVKMEENYALSLYPRSGLGFKYRFQLNNTVGIIDSDYYYSDNEGHIFSKFSNDTNENKVLYVDQFAAFMQGIFTEYFITEDDDASGIRNGGFGSTS